MTKIIDEINKAISALISANGTAFDSALDYDVAKICEENDIDPFEQAKEAEARLHKLVNDLYDRLDRMTKARDVWREAAGACDGHLRSPVRCASVAWDINGEPFSTGRPCDCPARFDPDMV